MENNKKVWFDDNIAEFIKNHNAISIHSDRLNKRYTLYWDLCKYVETEDPNIFEVIYPNDDLSELLNNRLRLDETKDNT